MQLFEKKILLLLQIFLFVLKFQSSTILWHLKLFEKQIYMQYMFYLKVWISRGDNS